MKLQATIFDTTKKKRLTLTTDTANLPADWRENILSVTFPDDVTVIEKGAFANCAKLKQVTLPSGLTTIEDEAFLGCAALKSITIPEQVTAVGRDAFKACSNLRKVYWNATCCGPVGTLEFLNPLPDWDYIDDHTPFIDCKKLKHVFVGDNVTIVPRNLFYSCYSIATITIGSSVTCFDHYAFDQCIGVKKVYYNGTQLNWGKIKYGAISNPLYHGGKLICKKR